MEGLKVIVEGHNKMSEPEIVVQSSGLIYQKYKD